MRASVTRFDIDSTGARNDARTHRERWRHVGRVVDGPEVARHRRGELHTRAHLVVQATALPRPTACADEGARPFGRQRKLGQVERDGQLPVYRIDREAGAVKREATGGSAQLRYINREWSLWRASALGRCEQASTQEEHESEHRVQSQYRTGFLRVLTALLSPST